MSDLTIRDLRNRGGDVIDRVLSGETVVSALRESPARAYDALIDGLTFVRCRTPTPPPRPDRKDGPPCPRS